MDSRRGGQEKAMVKGDDGWWWAGVGWASQRPPERATGNQTKTKSQEAKESKGKITFQGLRRGEEDERK